MQRTKSKILSILLSLVMLLSLVPAMGVTALAAGNYPDHVRVFNASGDTTSLSDGQCLVTNDGKATSYNGGAYVARYDKSSGTLFLKDYHVIVTDNKIFADGDLNIKVESDSSFTTSTTASGNLYGIRADSGKLNISGTGKLTVTANGRGNVYGISAKEGVTIAAPLAVKVGKNSTAENGPVYGIHAQSGTISLPGNDMTVTATGGTENAYGVYNEAQTSPSAAGNGNIGISGNLTVNLSGGSNYNRGISSQGGDITLNGATVKILGSYHYGIFNLNGNVVIKSTPDVELTSTTPSGEGICTYDGGDLTIENSTVKVSVDTLAANLKGNVSIQDSKVELTSTYKHHEVIGTGNSSTANTIDLSGSGSVTLTASGDQSGSSMIGGKVTTTPGTKLEKGKHNPNLKTYDGAYDEANNITVLQFVHEDSAPTTNISVSNWPDPTVFDSAEEGYDYAQARNLTIDNKGEADTGELTITVVGKNPDAFTVSPNKISNIAVGGKAESTVRPANGLAAGTYTATLKISGDNVNTLSINVQFTVKDVTIYLIGDVNKDGAVSVSDMQRLYAHLNGTKPLTDTSTADVNNDKVISVSDMQRLYAHLNGTKPLS